MFTPNVDKFFEEFKELVAQIPDASSKNTKPIDKDDIDRLFPSNLDGEEREFLVLKAALKAMFFLESDKEKFDDLKESMNIYQVLAYYLLSIFPYCSEKFFREYLLLTIMICKALNEKGEMYATARDQGRFAPGPEGSQRTFCEGSNIYVIAEILNLFIAELFPAFCKKFKALGIQFDFLGMEDEHIKNLILMTKVLASWLFNNEFTEFKLEINIDL